MQHICKHCGKPSGHSGPALIGQCNNCGKDAANRGEFISYGARWTKDDVSPATGSAMLTPEQADEVHEHMVRSLGNRKCIQHGATINKLAKGDYELDCAKCDLHAIASPETAKRLGWI